jgi:putative nucleic acid binding protein
MKKLAYILISLLLISIAAFAVYRYINRPVASTSGKDAQITVTPQKLLADFEKDENAANIKYLDKVIAVKGKINSIKTDNKNNISVILDTGNPMSGISCNLEKSQYRKSERLKTNDEVKIKGVCSGMLMDVVMVSCVIDND